MPVIAATSTATNSPPIAASRSKPSAAPLGGTERAPSGVRSVLQGILPVRQRRLSYLRLTHGRRYGPPGRCYHHHFDKGPSNLAESHSAAPEMGAGDPP